MGLFIARTERCGMIRSWGNWRCADGCPKQLDSLVVAVNVTARHLQEPSFVGQHRARSPWRSGGRASGAGGAETAALADVDRTCG